MLILAAGSSRRLGRSKQLEVVGGETLLARAVRIARDAALGPVYTIIRSGDEDVLAEVTRLGCEVVLHSLAGEGIAASIRAGVQVVTGSVAGALLMVCDQPMVTAEHLRQLALQAEGAVIGSAYGGRHGVPAWFPARAFPELLKLRGDTGARELLQFARTIELVGGEVDLDTEEDLARIRNAVPNRK